MKAFVPSTQRSPTGARKRVSRPVQRELSLGLGLSLMHIDGAARVWKSAPGASLFYEKDSYVGIAEVYINGQELTGLSAGGGVQIRLGKSLTLGFLASVGVWEGRHWVTDNYTYFPLVDEYPVVQTAILWLQPFIKLGGKISILVRPRLAVIGFVEERRVNGFDRSAAAAGLTTDVVYRF